MTKSILIIIPYEKLYPPVNGGMLRCFHILHQLCKQFKVTAIIQQDKKEFLSSTKYFPSISNAVIYSTKDEQKPTDLFSLFPTKIKNALRYRWYRKKLFGTADGSFLMYYPTLKRILKIDTFDVVIIEKLATLNAVGTVRKFNKDARIIYDAHNVDTNLAFAEKSEYYSVIHKAESTLYKTVDAILSCSHNDLEDFQRINQYKLPGVVIPNGVHIENRMFDEGVRLSNPRYIVFCGSLDYEPNSDGLLWFYNKIWTNVKIAYPDLKLLIVGSGRILEKLQPIMNDESLIFTGIVPDVKPYYNKASLAIVPIKIGSGTRLKVLESMGLGVPVVSTSKGAEGIDYTDGENILIANEEKAFANRVVDLLNNKALRLKIQQNASELVQNKYDWNVIGEKLYLFLND